MNTDQFKPIFSRFQNLNLLALIEDLRHNQVTALDWYSHGYHSMCPVAHGFSTFREKALKECETTTEQHNLAALEIGSNPAIIGNFIWQWDMAQLDYREEPFASLLATLTGIWNERLEDADAVQAVCSPVLVEAV